MDRHPVPGRVHGHFDDVLLADLAPHGLVLRREAQPRKKEDVRLAGDELRGPVRPVVIPVPPQPVEVGEPVAEVVGVAFQHGFDIGLTGDHLHAACSDRGLGVAGDAVVAEGLDRIARDHHHLDLADGGEQRSKHLPEREAQGEFVGDLELVDAGEAVSPDELGVVLAEALESEGGVLGDELAAVQRRLVLPVHVRLDVVDEGDVIDDLGQLRHRRGEHPALIHVVEVVVDREDAAVEAAVVGDGRVEDAAVAPEEGDDASAFRAAVGGLGGGLLCLLLFVGGRRLSLLLLDLLFGLLLGLLLLH